MSRLATAIGGPQSPATPNGRRAMPAALSDKENQDLVRRAIALAEDGARSDAEFVQLLRSTYFAQHPVARRQLPALRAARGGIRSATGSAARAGTASADPSLH